MSLPATQRNVFLRAAARKEARDRAHEALNSARRDYLAARNAGRGGSGGPAACAACAACAVSAAELERLCDVVGERGDAYILADEAWKQAQAQADALVAAPAVPAGMLIRDLSGLSELVDL